MSGDTPFRRVGDRRLHLPTSGTGKRQTWVTGDFFTQTHRISGSVDVYRELLADQLNNPNITYMWLEQVYVSPIDRPGEITANYPVIALGKDNITMIVLPTREEGLTTKQTHPSYVWAKPRRIFLTVAGFEVRGEWEIKGAFSVNVLARLNLFVPVLDGRASATLKPEIQYQGGIILVNKLALGVVHIQD